MSAEHNRRFLETVLVWPDPQGPGWINLHVNSKNENPTDTSKKNNEGKPWMIGWPYKTVKDLVDRYLWTENTDTFLNAWMCMSLQSTSGKFAKSGKPKAIRLAKNALAVKSIWIDCDVKVKPADHPTGEPWKHYETLGDAWKAIRAFQQKVGLPEPTAVVDSGGGLHIYWTNDGAMTPAEWRPYADGLKALLLQEGVLCDTGLTTDIARILRVPGTLNHKYSPPRVVRLLHLGQVYDFPTALSALRDVASPAIVIAAPFPARGVIEPGHENEFDNGPDPAFSKLVGADDLAAGIIRRSRLSLAPGPVFEKCGFMGEAKAKGGADYNNTLWMYSILNATFFDNGNAIAHEISRGHPSYTHAETQALFERKLADRADRGLGWPRCATIHGAGCKACGTCPFLAADKSPLHLTEPVTTNRTNRKPLLMTATTEFSSQPVTRNEPEFANLDALWLKRIFEGDTDCTYGGDRAQLAFAVACELVRIGLHDEFIARVLMTAKCGEHVQESPVRRTQRTIARAHEFAIDPDLEDMNSKHGVLPIGDKTRVVTWGSDNNFADRNIIVRAQTFQDFASLHSNKRKIISSGETDTDGKPIKKGVPRGKWWLGHERRRQYDGGQKFMPQHDADVVGDTLNMYNGFALHPRKPAGRSGASGCQLFLNHGFEVICSGNEEHWDYLLKREAWIVQQRRRSEIAAAYRTEAEGSGKGFWCTHLGRLFGQHFMQVSNPDHVIGKHNPHLETLIKLCADEALFVGDPRHRNALFSLITEPTLTIEPKFVGVYKAANYLNIDITTNAKHFVPASRTARRFFIPTVSENRVGDLEYFKRIEAQLRDGGYEALLYHLQNEVDLRDFDVRRVPKTAGLAEQVEYSRKGLDGLLEKICSEGRVPCAHGQWPGFSVSNGYEAKQGFDYFVDTHHDRELRDFQALKVKRQLRRDWGCLSGDDAKRRDGGNMTYGVKWPPLAELREMFVKRHGPQEWLHPEVIEWPGSASTQPGPMGQFVENRIEALNDQDPPRTYPIERTAPPLSEAALIAKDIDAAERFIANRRR